MRVHVIMGGRATRRDETRGMGWQGAGNSPTTLTTEDALKKAAASATKVKAANTNIENPLYDRYSRRDAHIAREWGRT